MSQNTRDLQIVGGPPFFKHVRRAPWTSLSSGGWFWTSGMVDWQSTLHAPSSRACVRICDSKERKFRECLQCCDLGGDRWCNLGQRFGTRVSCPPPRCDKGLGRKPSIAEVKAK